MLAWDVGQGAWQELLGAARCGLQQGWSYGEALRQGGVPVHRALLRGADGAPLGGLQLSERRLIRPVGAAFLLRGPIWLQGHPGPDHETAMLAAIRTQLRPTILVWAPELKTPLARRPIITGYGTAWLDLASGVEAVRQGLASDWRAHLRQAEAGPLTVRRLATAQVIAWLLDHNEAHRRRIGYRGPSRRFLGQLALSAHAARELALLLAFERAEPVAGIMILRHGESATYGVGYVSPRGRELHATHLLLWRAVETLIRLRVRWLDLGGIATDRSPGIARFKLGLGGEVATLPGTFLVRCPGRA
jgi:hypothetical protein